MKKSKLKILKGTVEIVTVGIDGHPRLIRSVTAPTGQLFLSVRDVVSIWQPTKSGNYTFIQHLVQWKAIDTGTRGSGFVLLAAEDLVNIPQKTSAHKRVVPQLIAWYEGYKAERSKEIKEISKRPEKIAAGSDLTEDFVKLLDRVEALESRYDVLQVAHNELNRKHVVMKKALVDLAFNVEENGEEE